jgi:hypothetical protein
VTATEANGATAGTVVIQQTAPPNTVVVTATPQTIVGNGSSTSTVRATVTNPSGTVVSGDLVTFTLSGTCGSVIPATKATDTNGVATVVYTSATTPGFCTVTAREATTGGNSTVVITQTT